MARNKMAEWDDGRTALTPWLPVRLFSLTPCPAPTDAPSGERRTGRIGLVVLGSLTGGAGSNSVHQRFRHRVSNRPRARRWHLAGRAASPDRRGDRAVLIADDDARRVELPLASLPFRVREAMVLAVPLDTHGKPRWDGAERDEAEEGRRLAEGKARLERLQRRDPGGDVGL